MSLLAVGWSGLFEPVGIVKLILSVVSVKSKLFVVKLIDVTVVDPSGSVVARVVVASVVGINVALVVVVSSAVVTALASVWSKSKIKLNLTRNKRMSFVVN